MGSREHAGRVALVGIAPSSVGDEMNYRQEQRLHDQYYGPNHRCVGCGTGLEKGDPIYCRDCDEKHELGYYPDEP